MKRLREVEFAVVREAGGWRVISEDRTFSHHAFRVDAEEAAFRLAVRARTAGWPCVVLVQDQFGNLQPMAQGPTPAW